MQSSRSVAIQKGIKSRNGDDDDDDDDDFN